MNAFGFYSGLLLDALNYGGSLAPPIPLAPRPPTSWHPPVLSQGKSAISVAFLTLDANVVSGISASSVTPYPLSLR